MSFGDALLGTAAVNVGPSPVRSQPDAAGLASLQAHYDAGRYLDAWHASQAFCPIATWTSTPALVLGGRLATQWGDDALSHRLHLRAYRKSPENDTAFYYFILSIHAKHGAFEALRLLRERTATWPENPLTQTQADLWIHQARLLSGFRDFAAAETCMARVENAFPESPWLWTEKSGLLREQDRYEESLAAARYASQLRPWYRPAIQAQVHLLQLLGRDKEALTLMEDAQQHLQCAAIVQTYALALDEESRTAEIPAALERVAELQPLASTSQLRWRAARRCDASHRLGKDDHALAAAREAGPGYYTEIVKRLSATAAPDDRRVQLSVGFVRQHHMTCAPATMTALSHYWKQPVDHAELSRAICYDGTPAHLERAWAEEHGWIVRDFRITWDSARALIDRGCPFALITVGIRSGHMQAIIGYDSRLGTLLIRDPYQRSYSDWLATGLFESHVSSGPRGMVMIPRDQAALLEGIELPDEAMHTHLHTLQLALARHDRTTAGAALLAMETADAAHLLTQKARFELAYYDANPEQALKPVQVLRERFPTDVNLQLDELQLLNQLGRAAEHRELLGKLGNRPSAPLVFQRQEAEELTRDARNHPRALKLLRRALRRNSSDAATLVALANLLWTKSRHEDATALYRLAACAADKVESHWDSYFKASRHIRGTEESLGLIQRRFQQWGDRSSQPARTLFECLEALERTSDAFAILDAACEKRPDDGDLLLFAADARGRYGRHAEARELMQLAQSKAAPAAWRRTAANLAGYQGDHALALSHWREIITINPADTFAHSSVARLLAVVESRAAALGHLDEACEKQPHLLPLRQTQVQWLRDESIERLLTTIDELLTLDPNNAWTHREKALALLRKQRPHDALACADEALRIAPFAPVSQGVRGNVLKALNRVPEALECYRAGLRLSIDADWLFTDLLTTCPDFAARREAVAFLNNELLRQPSLDNAYLQFRATARSILTPEELQRALETLWNRHPESWSAWSVLINHLLDQNLLPEALAKASDATARFALTPRIWLDLGNVHAQRGDTASAANAYEKALAIIPGWGLASRHLSKIHERTLRLDLAAQVLRRAIAMDPNDGPNHAWLADVLWRQNDTDGAITAIEKAIAICPDYAWAWNRLAEWSAGSGHPERARQLAELLTQTRAGEADSWMRLVRLRFEDHSPEENLKALDRAAALAPFNPDVHDLRAELLASHKRYDEAIDACQPAAFGDAPPSNLQGRAAWIEHRRGRVASAIERMGTVVEAHPDYLWGWSLLTTWYWEEKKFEDVKRTAARWAWLAPEASLPHGYIATVHKNDGRKKDAKEALARSLSADPTYEFGAFELLSSQLDDSEFDAVQQTLRHIETHFPASHNLRALLQYHRTRKDRGAAREHLHKLGRLPGLVTDELNASTNIVLQAGWEKEVEKAFAPLLADETTSPEIGRLWAKARVRKSLTFTLGLLLLKLHPTPAHRRNIDCALVEQLANAKRIHALRMFCLLRRRELRAHQDTWGQVGYAFNACQRFRAVTRWMRNWREHPEAPPWMRVNLIQALYSRKKIVEAREVLISALERPRDHTHDMLLVWLACEQALDGETSAALATQSRVTANRLSDYDKALITFTDCMVAVQQAATDDKRAALTEARDKLRNKARELPAICRAPALKLFHRRTLLRLGQDGDSLWVRIRSRLPLWQFTDPADGITIPAPLIWFGIIVLIGAMRSCIALIE